MLLCHMQVHRFVYRNGGAFNLTKFEFGRREVDFLGFTVTENGVRPTRKMLVARLIN